jgi:ornithine carbamoyltransferase
MPIFSIERRRMMLKGRHVISLKDFSRDELYMILDTAAALKVKQRAGEPHKVLADKTLGMIFERPSTRTRVSFEVGMTQLGGHAQFLASDKLQLAQGEPVKDTARVLSRYVDGIMYRGTFDALMELAKYSTVPVISAAAKGSGTNHPCQTLADFQTIREKKLRFDGLKVSLCWVSGNPGIDYKKPPTLVYDYIFACSKLGMDLVLACPEGYDPFPQPVMEQAQKEAAMRGASIRVVRDIYEGAAGADVIHCKNWVPLNFPDSQKPSHFLYPDKYKKWIIDDEVVSKAKKDVIVMNALPAYRGFEITEEVIEGPNSVVFDEAENRLHAQKAVMVLVMK